MNTLNPSLRASIKRLGAIVACWAAWSGPANAHVALEQSQALAQSSYRAVFRVGHGCNGWPTTGIAVLIPVGVQGSKPMPKPGWAVTTRTERLETPYTSHGKRVTDDVVEVSWVAQSPEAALPDAHYDEFILRAGLPAQAGPLWFKVVQTCSDGTQIRRVSWDQVPAAGTSTQGLKTPAVLLQVEAPAGHAHH